MPQVAVRGLPEDVHRKLKEAARRNHRSLNGEIVTRLTASVNSNQIDPQALLDQIQRRYERIGPIHLSDSEIRELRDAGRR